MRPPGLIVSVECRSLLPNYHILNRLNEPYIKRALSRYSIFSSGETGGGGRIGGLEGGVVPEAVDFSNVLQIETFKQKSAYSNPSIFLETFLFLKT